MSKQDLKDFGTYLVTFNPTNERLAAKGIDVNRLNRTRNYVGIGAIAFQLTVIFGPVVYYKTKEKIHDLKIEIENRKIDKYNKK